MTGGDALTRRRAVMLPNVQHVFVASIHRRADRRARVCAQLDALGISHEVFEGFDGGDLRLKTDVCSPFLKNGPIPCGRVGNYLTQIAMFREALRRSLGNVLIIEDDAKFLPDFVSKAGEAIAQLPDGWDMLYFGAWDWDKDSARDVSPALIRPGRPMLRHAVLHSPGGLLKLVEHTRQFSDTIDVTCGRLAREMNVFATREKLALQFDCGDSDAFPKAHSASTGTP